MPGLAQRSADCSRPRTSLPVISEPLAKLKSSPRSRSPSETLPLTMSRCEYMIANPEVLFVETLSLTSLSLVYM